MTGMYPITNGLDSLSKITSHGFIAMNGIT